MYIAELETKQGKMLAVADDSMLYLLEFVGRKALDREIKQLKLRTKRTPTPGKTHIIDLIEKELEQYFLGKLTQFTTPIFIEGTPFQRLVWKELQKIPYGETRSYAEIAHALGKPTAYRAVANANGSNQLAIIIPCHRVINSNGRLGGYGGGIAHKEGLLNLEKKEA